MNKVAGWGVLALAGYILLSSFMPQGCGNNNCPDCRPQPVPTPVTPEPTPSPNPTPAPRRPWGPRFPVSVEAITIGGPTAPDGRTSVFVDLPTSQRIRNIGSRRDGAGMCVMSSIEMMFRWGNLEAFRGLRDWCAEQPGGGYPEKVTRQITEYCAARHCQAPPYFQYEGRDPALIRAALATGRPVAVTYCGRDQVRYRGTISHMVLLVHYDDHYVCILDNNAIGESELLWMTPQEFLDRWTCGQSGWAVFSLASPPPPCPH